MPINPVLIIQKKRDGQALADHDIATLIAGFVSGEVPDYQMSAFAMAVYFRGMDARETAALTKAMLESGATLDWTGLAAPKVDKHSTGGVGDKVSLVLAPLLACCGLVVPMISGRGLGATGGTLDKLESIPGFRTRLSEPEIRRQAEAIGCVMAGQTDQLVPADKKLYALRDVTATVPSIPLITASIMSKKLAENLDALVLDVKWGSGAFMKTQAEARELAESMVNVGRLMGLKTRALLTDMNQPLGRKAGHALEVEEAIECLCGHGPPDLEELVLRLGAELLDQTGVLSKIENKVELLRRFLDRGRAYERFEQMVNWQGGRLNEPRPIAPVQPVWAKRPGYVVRIDAEKLGLAIAALGGGRRKVTDAIDFSVGLEMHVRLGEEIHEGDLLLDLYAHEHGKTEALQLVDEAVEIGDSPIKPPALIVED